MQYSSTDSDSEFLLFSLLQKRNTTPSTPSERKPVRAAALLTRDWLLFLRYELGWLIVRNSIMRYFRSELPNAATL